MKIGIMTFHWATNYGAVLQAYALQKTLQVMGHTAEIINYLPFRVRLHQKLMALKGMRLKEFLKERRIQAFRNEHLGVSVKKYRRNASLVTECHGYDAYICGSDQIWNKSFIRYAERKPTLSYYLNFVREGKLRISYAASFGSEILSSDIIDLIRPELTRFSSISVREKSGQAIVEAMGLNAVLTIDPTLLLTRNDYGELLGRGGVEPFPRIFSYILHERQTLAQEVAAYVSRRYFNGDGNTKNQAGTMGMYWWLDSIGKADFVVTNSFHGLVFALIFHKPFVVIPVEGSEMNDRIFTLLHSLGMEDRVINKFDVEAIDSTVTGDDIAWNTVDKKIGKMRDKSIQFLYDALKMS